MGNIDLGIRNVDLGKFLRETTGPDSASKSFTHLLLSKRRSAIPLYVVSVTPQEDEVEVRYKDGFVTTLRLNRYPLIDFRPDLAERNRRWLTSAPQSS